MAAKYASAAALRNALEERLRKTARKENTDIMRLRRKVAFDRLLARLFHEQTGNMLLKGGYALELRLESARATKDIDLSIKGGTPAESDHSDFSGAEKLQAFLQDAAAHDTGDFFEYVIGAAVLDLENAPYGGHRFPVEARLAGRMFIRFNIDLAYGDVWLGSREFVATRDWLGFAGIRPPRIPVISREQQFAEKLHAYTLPRERTNSRVKDLVDLVLLIQMGGMGKARVRKAVEMTFQRRETHPVPKELPDPPELWQRPFNALAKSVGLALNLEEAISRVREFYRSFNFLQKK